MYLCNLSIFISFRNLISLLLSTHANTAKIVEWEEAGESHPFNLCLSIPIQGRCDILLTCYSHSDALCLWQSLMNWNRELRTSEAMKSNSKIKTEWGGQVGEMIMERMGRWERKRKVRERNFVSNVFLKDKLNYKNNRETGDILHPDKEIYTQRELLILLILFLSFRNKNL